MYFLRRAAVFRADRFDFFLQYRMFQSQVKGIDDQIELIFTDLQIFFVGLLLYGLKSRPAFSLGKEGPDFVMSMREWGDWFSSLVPNMLFFFIIKLFNLIVIQRLMKHIEEQCSVISKGTYQNGFVGLPTKDLNPGLPIQHAKEEIPISKQILIQVDDVLSYSVVASW